MNETEKKARAARLKQARLFANFGSAQQAVDQFDWAGSTYRSHENGTRGIGKDDALIYAQAFRVSLDWLFDGRGPMLPLAELPGVAPNATLPPRIVPLPQRQLPVYGHAMAGDEGVLVLSSEIVDTAPCPGSLDAVPNAYALYVSGDSMEPRYYAGEVVHVHPTRPPRRGNFVVVQVSRAGEPTLGYIKRFVSLDPAHLTLEQLNPERTIRIPRADVSAIHVIVGSATP